jgi:hypothetical protein
MPKLLREFKCPTCGEISERFLDTSVEKVECSCGSMAVRQIGMPTVSLEGISGAFPGAHDKWARIREDNARIKAKRNA